MTHLASFDCPGGTVIVFAGPDPVVNVARHYAERTTVDSYPVQSLDTSDLEPIKAKYQVPGPVRTGVINYRIHRATRAMREIQTQRVLAKVMALNLRWRLRQAVGA